MELKSYQQAVLQDLRSFLDKVEEKGHIADAYSEHWQEKLGPYNPLDGKGMRPYQNNLPGAIHVCLKVPTAGGKTFLAVNALHTIFTGYAKRMPRAVVWLVPWSNLLDQTVRALSNPDHPYRQKLNSLFNHRVQIYRKEDLLQGSNFSPATVQEQVSILVMSFASLRVKNTNKEDRKVYQENGQLAPFAAQNPDTQHVLDGTDETALINVIRSLNPVVVVDESHNAESDLSVDMLKNLNPSFVLDLTATPRNNSNLVSIVPAIQLKAEHMVKLPVIVYNHQDKSDVIESALHLRKKLEALAITQEQAGGKYIRPIVLFQAQPRTGEEKVTFEKLKANLLKLKIPEAQIKIKTAEIDELKGIDLMARDCEVRYIITVNALKEGWDCPFAYVLASLADKSSAIDVEQILGRVLRQPYVQQHSNSMLNVSYVLTASAKFTETLGSIVKGLQNSGFSEKDYRQRDAMPEPEKKQILEQGKQQALESFLNPTAQPVAPTTDEIDISRVTFDPTAPITAASPATPSTLETITQIAVEENQRFEEEARRLQQDPPAIFEEMKDKVTAYPLSAAFADLVKGLELPQFVMDVEDSIFTGGDLTVSLNPEALLKGYKLSQEDIKISFEQVATELYQVDIKEAQKGDYTPQYNQLAGVMRESYSEYILSRPLPEKIKTLALQLKDHLGRQAAIGDKELERYLLRVMEDFSDDRVRDVMRYPKAYASKIKEKIKQLCDRRAEVQFNDMIASGEVRTMARWKFPEQIIPPKIGPAIAKSLYTHEGEMNRFEETMMSRFASLDNIVCFLHQWLYQSLPRLYPPDRQGADCGDRNQGRRPGQYR
jgi:type III restriction enzyme